MTYQDFMHKLINLGIEGAKADYVSEVNAARLAGSIDGFMECRGKMPSQIMELLVDARKKGQEAYVRVNEKEISDDEYWRVRCREMEIEWVATCVSAMLSNQGVEPLIPFTAQAVLMVAKIVGVRLE